MSGAGERRNKQRRGLRTSPDLLEDLAAKAADLAKKLLDAPEHVAEAFGAELALAMAKDWGGQSIYFPLGTYYRVTSMHQAIWDAFDGTNHNELAGRFHISRVWVYKIVDRMRAADVASRQKPLFPPPPDPV